MWEALLANAGDPRNSKKNVHRGFVRLLKELEPLELKVLEALYQIDDPEKRPSTSPPFSNYPDNEEITESMEEIGHDVSVSESQLNIAKINLGVNANLVETTEKEFFPAGSVFVGNRLFQGGL